jgi:hypothetical protein
LRLIREPACGILRGTGFIRRVRHGAPFVRL